MCGSEREEGERRERGKGGCFFDSNERGERGWERKEREEKRKER